MPYVTMTNGQQIRVRSADPLLTIWRSQKKRAVHIVSARETACGLLIGEGARARLPFTQVTCERCR